MLDVIWTEAEPYLRYAVGLFLTTMVTLVMEQARRYLGAKATDRLRGRLDEAMENGFLQADTQDLDVLAAAMVAYVKAGIPDAVAKLKASDSALLRRAKATIGRFGMIDRLGTRAP